MDRSGLPPRRHVAASGGHVDGAQLPHRDTHGDGRVLILGGDKANSGAVESVLICE